MLLILIELLLPQLFVTKSKLWASEWICNVLRPRNLQLKPSASVTFGAGSGSDGWFADAKGWQVFVRLDEGRRILIKWNIHRQWLFWSDQSAVFIDQLMSSTAPVLAPANTRRWTNVGLMLGRRRGISGPFSSVIPSFPTETQKKTKGEESMF